MPREMRKQLDLIFGTQARANPPQSEAYDFVKVSGELMAFNDIKSKVIRPRMEELSKFLQQRSVSSSISENEKLYDRVGRTIGTVGITMRVYSNASHHDNMANTPHYAVYWESVNSIARFYRNTNTRLMAGEAGLDGKAMLHELNSQMIEAKLMDFARNFVR